MHASIEARNHRWSRAVAVVTALMVGAATAVAAGLPAGTQKALDDAEYVYISSQRKDGSFGEKAEIWFMQQDGVVYVGTRPSSWRVKRIQWGRPKAKIWVGSRDGPSYEATGSLVKDPALQEKMFEVFAKKYPGGWPRHEEGFRKGFQDGSRVMVAYKPVG